MDEWGRGAVPDYSGLRGWAAKRRKKTTIADSAAAARADLIRRSFTADAAQVNTRWCDGITYIPTWEGWLYLSVTWNHSACGSRGLVVAG
jgi:transposase InsO family protein